MGRCQQQEELGDTKTEKLRSMVTFIEMRAVVVCFNTTFRIRGVDMKGVQMSAYGFDGAEALTKREMSV